MVNPSDIKEYIKSDFEDYIYDRENSLTKNQFKQIRKIFTDENLEKLISIKNKDYVEIYQISAYKCLCEKYPEQDQHFI